jgi:hypothetical protein
VIAIEAGGSGGLRRALSNRVLPLFSGLKLLAMLNVLLVVALSLQADVNRYPSLSLGAALASFALRVEVFSAALFPLVPVVVIAFNCAPFTARLRIVWLIAIAIGYGFAASAIDIDKGTPELPMFILFGLIIAGVFEFQHRAAIGERVLARAQLDASALDAEMSRARLQLLRAQIEPHFLFNTLANVRQLARTDTSAATRMLDNLMQYFAAALPNLRNEETTLAQEAALLDAYLSIHRMRMGGRLTYQVEFPAELGGVRVPTMMLLTLVENAIKHGITPLTEGGAISVRAHRTDALLQLTVVDSGRGMTATAGSGTGLANIRSRLMLLYGNAAALSLSRLQPRGVAATITLPTSVGA